MKVSVLCVTHDRPEFIPWLFWNYERLEWDDKELIIVDSSEKKIPASQRKGATYHHAPNANVPTKRNIAIEKATGDCITWLDDDDWRHPESLKELSFFIDDMGGDCAGGRSACFVDIQKEEMRRFTSRNSILFAAMLIKTEIAKSIVFDEAIERGSDVDWLGRVIEQCGYRFTYEAPSLFLCHDRNMGNKASIHHFNRPLSEFVGTMINKKAWGDTSKQLAELRDRINGN